MTDYSSFFTKNVVNCLKSFIPNYASKRIKFKSKSKKKFDPVTVFDLKIEKKLHNLILKKYPNSNFIGEESINRDKKSKNFLTWVVDPIDGTKNFLIGSPVWSNLVGLCHSKKPLFGLAFFPILKKYYFSDSKKTYLFKNLKNKSTLKSSQKTDLNNSTIVTNTINTIKNKKILSFFLKHKGLFKISNLDALNYCLLAEGKVDIIVESKVKKVDIIPLIPIIENAGGKISNWRGESDISKGDILVSSNGTLHAKMISKLKKI
jgi:fructose-1,6-bisphosphatase/inositol monophosphatase family enzyme